MNVVDILILIVLLAGAVAGFRRGFILMAASILGAVIALAVARAEYVPVRHWLRTLVSGGSPWLTVIAYLAVFLVAYALVLTLARIARRGARLLMLGPADRFGGVIVGLLQSALLVELLLHLATHLHSGGLRHQVAGSTLAPGFRDFVPYLNKLFPHI